jgi:hypothetical protein
MGLLQWIGLGTEIAKPIDAVSNLYTTDKARLEAESKLEELTQKPVLTQLANNATMLNSKYFFESAWPSLIGWTAGFCVALYYIPQLMVLNYEWSRRVLVEHIITPFPIDPTDILNLVYLLFGFGAYHIAKKKLVG